MDQRKILLLENVATQAAGLREHLTQSGFEVAVSRYEADGLKRIVDWGPDVILVSTAHPAGDFAAYCRRVRALAPAVRIIVTSPIAAERLFRDHPDLPSTIDGVLLRPCRFDEVTAILAPIAPPVAAPAPDPDNAALRAEFQRALDERFLEVQELKRHLEVATRRAASAPGLEWLQSENEHLRQGVEDAQKKAALALATEQLKRSEIEVKLDNLLRMKEDFEFRVQNEVEERTRESEMLREQLEQLRERTAEEAAAHAALRVELESVLVEKEQVEERLHALESSVPAVVAPGEGSAPTADPARVAELETELSRQQAQAAAGQVALAGLSAKTAQLEESLTRERESRVVREREQAHAAQALREELAAARQQTVELQGELAGARQMLAAAASTASEAEDRAGQRAAELEAARVRLEESDRERERRRVELERVLAEKEQVEERLQALESSVPAVAPPGEGSAPPADPARVAELETELSRQRAQAAEGQVALAELSAKTAQLEESLAREQESRVVREREQAHAEQALREELAAARRQAVELQGELAGARQMLAAAASTASEAEDRAGQRAAELEAGERRHAEELKTARDAAATAALELRLLREQEQERSSREGAEQRAGAERQQQAASELGQRERQIAALREELAAAAAALVAAREGCAARERELSHRAEEQQAAARALEEKLVAQSAAAAATESVTSELHRIQELLEEVISRARTEAMEFARRDADLSARLQAALDERRQLQERFDRAGVEASERERRVSSLLQSAIDRGSFPGGQERPNLPAVVPLDPEPVPTPAKPRRRLVVAAFAAASVVLLLALLMVAFSSRPTAPPAVREQPQPVAQALPGAAPAPGPARLAATPRDVWDRWTRSDASGGVLVQATLRSAQELRAEIEGDGTRSLSEAEARAELARRLGDFRFDTTYYVNVYVKNLAPGYPAYLDNLPGHFRLRDGAGKEVPAFLPPGHEKDHRVFTFGAGAPGELIYEASVSLGFDRAGLSPSTGYLQLVVSDVGAASRRVLTWELE